VVDGEIVYTDEKTEYFFGGNSLRHPQPAAAHLTVARAAFDRRVLAKAAQEVAIKRVAWRGTAVLYTSRTRIGSFCRRCTWSWASWTKSRSIPSNPDPVAEFGRKVSRCLVFRRPRQRHGTR
jgi:hypothetical protein